jgi:Rrf2 family protein
MKLLSEAAESGLRSVLWMSQDPQRQYKVKEVADAVHAAPGYLIKVMQDLAKAGILAGRRGSQGGFTLIRSPDSLTALDVIQAIDPIERIHTCPLRLTEHEGALCPLHTRIDEALAAIESSFAGVTIAQLRRQASQQSKSSRKRPACELLCKSTNGEAK